MKQANSITDQPDFLKLLRYTGSGFVWCSARQGVVVGKVAGTIDREGYRRIKINGKKYAEHRLVYELHHGAIEDGLEIDHINGRRDDNRIANLRAVTKQLNCQNRKRPNLNNESGTLGVYLRESSKWRATAICPNTGRKIILGEYSTKQEAVASRIAYVRANYAGNTL
jgi:hypothetical protein